jgi:hypothetical protein
MHISAALARVGLFSDSLLSNSKLAVLLISSNLISQENYLVKLHVARLLNFTMQFTNYIYTILLPHMHMIANNLYTLKHLHECHSEHI